MYIEEYELAYLTDNALVGFNIMSEQQYWPKSSSKTELRNNSDENIWWFILHAN